MFKKRWLIPLVLILMLLGGLRLYAILLQRYATTISQGHCTARQCSGSGSGTPQTAACPRKLLVFTKTGGFRHTSIKDGKLALQKLATEHNFIVDFTEDAAAFTDANLSQYDAVVFLLTTGEILDGSQQGAFERYIQHGGGYVGIHSASDTEYDWPWYGRLVGAYFDRVHGRSRVTQATIHVTDHTHPATSMLPALWVRTDEWYNFAANPRGSVHVLMTIDEKTYNGGAMGADHPIAWYHAYDGGRAWYTALGHTPASYSEPLFLTHIWGGITYAAGSKPTTTPISSQPNLSIPMSSKRVMHQRTSQDAQAVPRSVDPLSGADRVAG